MDYYSSLKDMYDFLNQRHSSESAKLMNAIFKKNHTDIKSKANSVDYGKLYSEVEMEAGKAGDTAFQAGFEKDGQDLKNLARLMAIKEQL